MPKTMNRYVCKRCCVIFSRTFVASFCSRKCFGLARAAKTLALFWDRVDKNAGPDSCWPWTMACDQGYGVTSRDYKKVGAHRLAWELTHGQIKDHNMRVCHHCDNPPCCNPKHLFLGTVAENNKDAARKGRMAFGDKWARTHPKELRAHQKGEASGRSKLTNDEVRSIRQFLLDGIDKRELARRFGVTRDNISAIANRKSWKHI